MMTPSFDRGRIPTGCAIMSGSLLTGPPRVADEGGKKEGWGGFYKHVFSIDNPVPKRGLLLAMTQLLNFR
jgi:hypothetical protein